MTAFSNNTLKTSAIKAKSPICKKHQRRQLPEDLSDLDIVHGKFAIDDVGESSNGGVSNKHDAHKRYWRRILAERPGYKQLGKHESVKKDEITQAIYNYILSTGGRFLQLDTKTQKWFNPPQQIGLHKIKQALRGEYVPKFLKGEPVSATTAPLLTPLPTPSAPTEAEKFLAFLNQAPVAPEVDFICTPINDLGKASLELLSIMSEPSIDQMEDAWTRFPRENKSNMKFFEFNLIGHSLDLLMYGDLIATCDNIAQVESTVPQAPESLQAFLHEKMESAIPSSRTF